MGKKLAKLLKNEKDYKNKLYLNPYLHAFEKQENIDGMNKVQTIKIFKKDTKKKNLSNKSSFMDFILSKTRIFNDFKDMSSYVTSILKSSSYPFFVVDKGMKIQYMNPACLDFTGVDLSVAIGKIKCKDVFSSSMCKSSCAISHSIKTKEPVVGKKVKVKDKNGKEHTIIVNAGPLMDDDGNVFGGFEMWRDALPDDEEASRINKLLNIIREHCTDTENALIALYDKNDSADKKDKLMRKEIISNIKNNTANLAASCNRLMKSNCWDIMDCPPERQVQCPAFPNNGSNCWEIDYTWCDGQMQGRAEDKKSDKCVFCIACNNSKNQ